CARGARRGTLIILATPINLETANNDRGLVEGLGVTSDLDAADKYRRSNDYSHVAPPAVTRPRLRLSLVNARRIESATRRSSTIPEPSTLIVTELSTSTRLLPPRRPRPPANSSRLGERAAVSSGVAAAVNCGCAINLNIEFGTPITSPYE